MFSFNLGSFFNSSYQQKQWINLCVTSLFVLLIIGLLFCPDFAHASKGSGMPYEDGLTKIKESLTGPYALIVSIAAVIGAFVGLIFGGDLNGFIKTLLFIVIGVAVIVNAASLISLLGSTGAMIAASDVISEPISVLNTYTPLISDYLA